MRQFAHRFDLYTIDSPFGRCTILFQAEPFCIFRIVLPGQSVPGNCTIADCVNPPPPLLEVVCMIQGYLEGNHIGAPPWQWLHTRALTELERAVLEATAQIPYASLRSYRDIANAIGRSKAFRFVGSALGKNLFPILIPCHRVIRSSGEIGGFSAGTTLKQKLIALEARFNSPRDSENTQSF